MYAAPADQETNNYYGVVEYLPDSLRSAAPRNQNLKQVPNLRLISLVSLGTLKLSSEVVVLRQTPQPQSLCPIRSSPREPFHGIGDYGRSVGGIDMTQTQTHP